MRTLRRASRVLPSRGELYRRKTLFLDNFYKKNFFYPNGTWTHPPTSKLFLAFFKLCKAPKSSQFSGGDILTEITGYNFVRQCSLHRVHPSIVIGLYHENAIAIQNESDDSNRGNVNTSQCKLRSTFRNLRVTNVIFIVTYYTLPPLESPDSFWMTRSQRSRRRDKGPCENM